APAAPELVHVHPDETVGAAISYLREYNVSQMPVVRHEPPLRGAEVAGAVLERELLAAVFADRAAVEAPVAAHMSAPLRAAGSGAPLSPLVAALGGDAPAVLVLASGTPLGILPRAAPLSFRAAGCPPSARAAGRTRRPARAVSPSRTSRGPAPPGGRSAGP